MYTPINCNTKSWLVVAIVTKLLNKARETKGRHCRSQSYRFLDRVLVLELACSVRLDFELVGDGILLVDVDRIALTSHEEPCIEAEDGT
jgi:hypothetical protein